MKSAILYASFIAAPGTTLVKCGDTPLFVRGEMVDEDVCDALEKAKPRDGEIVLNTVEIKP